MIKTIGLLAVVIVIFGIVVYTALRPPIGSPDESRRVAHPAGFSVISPLGWEKHTSYSTSSRSLDSVRFLPTTPIGPPGYFAVTKLPEAPNKDRLDRRGFKPSTFDGKPAWENGSEQELTHEHSRSILFERDNEWFEIGIKRPTVESLDTGTWQAYAESFQISPKFALPAAPTLLPATLPSATLPATLPE